MNPNDLAWQAHARCHDAPQEWFYQPELPAKHQEQRDKRAINKLLARGLPQETAEELFRLHKEQRDPYVRARIVCSACPVRRQCLEFALEPANRIVEGIWGGLNEVERRKITKTRATIAATNTYAVAHHLAS